jgi:hypothetical protein
MERNGVEDSRRSWVWLLLMRYPGKEADAWCSGGSRLALPRLLLLDDPRQSSLRTWSCSDRSHRARMSQTNLLEDPLG